MSIIITSLNLLNTSIDWSGILFDRWWEMSIDEVKNQSIFYDNRQTSLSEIVEINHLSDNQKLIIIHPGDNLFHGLGTNLKQGRIIIKGNAGHRLGFKLAGGTIVVEGNTLDYTAQGIIKGLVIIRGNCGDYLAAPRQGDKTGMLGGEIHIQGNAGVFAGQRMRRGLITIKNSSGFGLASEMLAGTVIVGNPDFSHLGTGIRRGTIVSLKTTEKLTINGYKFACQYQPVWWRLYAKYLLDQQIYSSDDGLFDCQFHRYSGDLLELNKAEILLRV